MVGDHAHATTGTNYGPTGCRHAGRTHHTSRSPVDLIGRSAGRTDCRRYHLLSCMNLPPLGDGTRLGGGFQHRCRSFLDHRLVRHTGIICIVSYVGLLRLLCDLNVTLKEQLFRSFKTVSIPTKLIILLNTRFIDTNEGIRRILSIIPKRRCINAMPDHDC